MRGFPNPTGAPFGVSLTLIDKIAIYTDYSKGKKKKCYNIPKNIYYPGQYMIILNKLKRQLHTYLVKKNICIFNIFKEILLRLYST